MTDFRALCAELVAIEDALTGRALVSANQGQALDGFSALAHFRDIADRARAALARPKLQGPTDDELLRCLADVADECLLVDHPSDVVAAGRSLLARWGRPAIEPVPVAERLPGPEDCTVNPRDGQGQWCWGWVQFYDEIPYSGKWRMMRRNCLIDEASAWLPHHALPVPKQDGNDD